MKIAQKFIFGLLLAAAMTFALLPATAHAEGGVTEQYSSLTPGHTYYFDLSGESLPGTANDWLPDTSLRWVPFTYAGTINAYSLGPSANGDFSASTAASASPSDRSLFVAEYPVTTQVSWNTLNSQNLIFGRDYQNGGVSYILRSLSAGSQLTGRNIPVTQANNEWDQILAKDRNYIKNFLGTNGASWGQDTVFYNTTSPLYRSLRGYYAADWWWFLSPGAVSSGDPASYSSYNCSFRPALEITSDPSAVLKTLTFDMDGNGFLGIRNDLEYNELGHLIATTRAPGSLTSATVVYTGSITLPDFTADDGFTFLGSGWGKLRWSDGTNFYEPGKSYDLPAGTVLKPGYEPVAEQFNLQPGGIYYFDLSGEGIPGSVNRITPIDPLYGIWPDKTLKWVPFIYAGTVNAYSLDASSVDNPSAPAAAAASDRSLFVSAGDGFYDVSWNELNAAGLIFGRDYESGGVSYSLRSMSMGSVSNSGDDWGEGYATKWGAERGLPANNEWDQLLDKGAAYGFKSWNLADWIGIRRYMGQDSFAYSDGTIGRVVRNPSSEGFIRNHQFTLDPGSGSNSRYFRPVLEITSPLGTELKTITLDMGSGGTLGVNSTQEPLKELPYIDPGPITSATVVYTGSITLPEITAANGFNYTGSGTGTLGWYDGTTFYAPGTTVTLDTGKTLTAGYGVAAPAVDAGNSSVSDETTPVSPAANSAFTFTVSVRNAAGEPVSGLNQAAFAITENGAGSLTVVSVIEDGATGNYTVTARHDTAETITITAAVSGVTLTDTLGNVVVQAAADPSDFSVQLETAGSKTAGQPFNLSITGAKGTDGSALSGSINVAVTSDRDGEVHDAAVTFTDGAAAVPVTLTTAGSHTLTVTITGVTNPETAAATVAPAGVNAGKSTVSAGTTPASPVINSGFTFTATVRDAYDNPISGLAAGDFDITGNGTGSLTMDSVIEDGTTGNYTVTASYDTAETVAITVEVSSVEIGSIAGVVIQDAAADQSDFSVQLETAGDKTAGQPFNLSITNAKAVSGSALSGSINVTVTSSVYGEVHNAPITFTAGSATVPVTLTTVDDHVLTVTVTGVTNPETVNVTVVAAVTTGGISGTVLYDDGGGGSPLEGATVTVNAGGTDYTATTAADGAYTISNVPAGSSYTVTASKTGYTDGTVNNVSVTAGSTTANVNFLLATPVNGVIAGVAKDSGNNPISGVTVSLSVSGTVYQATTDTNGTYTISGVPAGSGYTVTASKAGYNSGTVNNVTVAAGSTATVNFTLTPVSGDAAVSIAAIPGIAAPVRGATPVTVITETAQYTGTVTWSPNNTTFAGGTVYTATITLTPKAGYTLTGVGANFFTVAGATSVSNAAGSGVVTAVFPATSSGGGGGGGSGSSSNGTNVTIQPDKKPDQPVIAGFSATPTVNSSGHGTVTISQQSVTDAITKALADAKAQGKTTNGIGISLNIDLPDTASSLGIVLPQATLQSLVNADVRQLEINGQLISLDLDLEALKEIQRQSTGDVTITIKPVQNLSSAARRLIGTRPVYDVTISYIKDGKTVNITSLGKGSATLSLPYTPGKNEAAGWLFGVYVDGKGNATRIPGSAYDANSGSILLGAGHLSVYGVGYTSPSEKYTDIATHWAKESIDYVVERGLFSGTTDTGFSPNTAMDRGMLVTVLGRLAGADVSVYKTSSFTDVAAGKYYLPYVEWAYKKGIVSGIGNGKFAPERAVTREEFALILQNYAKVTGYTLPVTREAITFADNGSIGSSYAAAVKAMQQAGIMMGGSGSKFNPKAGATRAEVAAMLHRYVKLTIDPATAQGWAKNDAGQYLYYKDSKPLTGWQTIDSMRYFFNTNGTLQTGWVKDGTNWRFYSGNKALVGWWDIGSETSKKRYYFDANAVMVSGKWLQIEGKWYYFYTDGSLARSTEIDGYEVDENGVRKAE